MSLTFFFFFLTLAVQNKTKANSPTGSSLPLHDSSFDYTSHQLHDLQPGSTVCHVRKPKVSCAGKELCSWIYCECVRRFVLVQLNSSSDGLWRWRWWCCWLSGNLLSSQALSESVQWWAKSQLLLIDITSSDKELFFSIDMTEIWSHSQMAAVFGWTRKPVKRHNCSDEKGFSRVPVSMYCLKQILMFHC